MPSGFGDLRSFPDEVRESLIIGCLDPASVTRDRSMQQTAATSGERHIVVTHGKGSSHTAAGSTRLTGSPSSTHRVTPARVGATGAVHCLRWNRAVAPTYDSAMKSGSTTESGPEAVPPPQRRVPLRTVLVVAAVILGLVVVAWVRPPRPTEGTQEPSREVSRPARFPPRQRKGPWRDPAFTAGKAKPSRCRQGQPRAAPAQPALSWASGGGRGQTASSPQIKVAEVRSHEAYPGLAPRLTPARNVRSG